MKTFKKAAAILCATACVAPGLVFTACGNAGDGDKAKSEYSVSQAEWLAAFDVQLFDNVTVERTTKQIDTSTNHWSSQTDFFKFDIANGRIYSKIKFDSSDETTEDSDSRYTISVKDGDTVIEYMFNSEDGWSYDVSDSDSFDYALSTVKLTVTSCKSLYDSFKFDNKTGDYILQSEMEGNTVRIENKRLVYLKSEFSVSGMTVQSTFTFKDYGTTVVELPDDLPPIEE